MLGEWNYTVYTLRCIYGFILTLRRVLAEIFGAEGSHM